MSGLVSGSLKRPGVRLLAHKILKSKSLSSREGFKVATALSDFVRTNIRYVNDPVDVETIQSPEVTVKIGSGDCDDHVVLLSSLLQSVGIPVRYVVVGRSRDRFSHIYLEALIASRWISVDTTIPGPIGRSGQLPEKKIYNNKGGGNMRGYSLASGLAGAPVVLPVRKSTVKRAAYKGAIESLNKSWRSGRINRKDLKLYLRLIDKGNSPARGTILEEPMRKAIEDFDRVVVSRDMVSFKPVDYEAQGLPIDYEAQGLEGLDGFLSAVWDGVKSSAQNAVNVGVQYASSVLSKTPSLPGLVYSPPVTQAAPVVTTTPAPVYAPAPVQAGIFDAFKSPVFLVMLGAAAFLIFRGKK
jgi:hypothetical protein